MASVPEHIFEVVDYEGKPVVLTRETWHAKAGNDESGKHPEIKNYLIERQFKTALCKSPKWPGANRSEKFGPDRFGF